MATYLENITTARDNLAATLAEHGHKPNYSIDGQSITWGELMDRLDKLNAAITSADGPFEVRTEGR